MADSTKKKRTPQQIGQQKPRVHALNCRSRIGFKKMVIPMLVVLHSIVAKLVRQEMWKVCRDSI